MFLPNAPINRMLSFGMGVGFFAIPAFLLLVSVSQAQILTTITGDGTLGTEATQSKKGTGRQFNRGVRSPGISGFRFVLRFRQIGG